VKKRTIAQEICRRKLCALSRRNLRQGDRNLRQGDCSIVRSCPTIARARAFTTHIFFLQNSRAERVPCGIERSHELSTRRSRPRLQAQQGSNSERRRVSADTTAAHTLHALKEFSGWNRPTCTSGTRSELRAWREPSPIVMFVGRGHHGRDGDSAACRTASSGRPAWGHKEHASTRRSLANPSS